MLGGVVGGCRGPATSRKIIFSQSFLFHRQASPHLFIHTSPCPVNAQDIRTGMSTGWVDEEEAFELQPHRDAAGVITDVCVEGEVLIKTPD